MESEIYNFSYFSPHIPVKKTDKYVPMTMDGPNGIISFRVFFFVKSNITESKNEITSATKTALHIPAKPKYSPIMANNFISPNPTEFFMISVHNSAATTSANAATPSAITVDKRFSRSNNNSNTSRIILVTNPYIIKRFGIRYVLKSI